jgi:O-acetylhomoserine (thiol)-lyase
VAALEGGIGAIATASGQAALHLTIATLMGAGAHIVASTALYGGSHNLLHYTLRRFGIETTFVPPGDLGAWRAAVRPETRLLFGETVGNPGMDVLDISAVSEIAHQAGVPLLVDATLSSPWLIKPLDWGADLIVHSATKFIGGHGTSIGGVLVESGKFPWDNGRFPDMIEPSRGYHGVKFYETFGDFGFTMKARMEALRTLGPALSPFNAFLLLQGLETLPLRMDRHVQNAARVAEFLKDHPQVSWVRYPSLKGDRYYERAQKYLPKGASAVMSFGIKGGQAAGVKFIENVQFLSHLANVGDAKTLVIHPASTTHRQLSEEQQISAGVGPDMIRISVGLETCDDILWDLDQALAKSRL